MQIQPILNIPSTAFKLHNLKPNQWYQVLTADRTFYCKLWPFEYKFIQKDSKFMFCQASANISRNPSNSERKLIEARGFADFSCCLVRQWPTKISRAIDVQLTIVSQPSKAFQSLSNEKQCERLLQVLNGFCLRVGCVVNDVYFHSVGVCVKVVGIQCEESHIADAIVTKDTEVLIIDEGEMSQLGDKLQMLDLDKECLIVETANNAVVEELQRLITYASIYKTHLSLLGVTLPKAVLIYGPPGVGKTTLVSELATRCGTGLVTINGSDLFGVPDGETAESVLRAKFNEARSQSSLNKAQVILFLDEVDAIAPKRDGVTHEASLVAQLLTLMDGMDAAANNGVFVIGATNRPHAIDPALRRPGRFDREYYIDAPTEGQRSKILSLATQKLPLSKDVDLKRLSAATVGFVAADLYALCREAHLVSLYSRKDAEVGQADFEHALTQCGIVPSALRGSQVVVEHTGWESHIAGLDQVKLKLRQCVEWPLKYSSTFSRLGLEPHRGILLYGPPGCSKTTLAKAVASTSNASFFTINSASLYSAFVGESERIIRSLFQRARAAQPAVIFIDEIDTLVGKRSLSSAEGGHQRDTVQERILSTLLNEMDGIELAKRVLVIGATNRPDMIDSALMRPGRFDRVIHVPPPDRETRLGILKMYTGKMPLESSVDLECIAEMTEYYTGADLKHVTREAAMKAIRQQEPCIKQTHLLESIKQTRPTITKEMLRQYDDYILR